MKTFVKLLLSTLESLIRLAAERVGIVKYATTVNPWMSGEKGRNDQLIFYDRNGEECTRRRPHKFSMKDPKYWTGRWNRFREFLRLGQSIKYNLADIFETKLPKMTYFNMMLRQLNKFWVGGPAPAPYVFTPGVVEVWVGGGTMPDARDVVFTPQAGGKLKISWDTSLTYPCEYDDDILQVLIITEKGLFGVCMPKIVTGPGVYVKRNDGTYTWTVPSEFLNPAVSLKCYCAVKFKAGAELSGKVKGIFKFPVGITPITLLP